MTYIILAFVDALLLAYSIITYIVVVVKGAWCFTNENKDYPYTQEMVDDPETYPYASDPEPRNIHLEVQTVMLIVLGAISINLLSDMAKAFVKIDTGLKRIVVNALKITHILTLGALIYMTYLRYCRAGVVCSCDVYPLPSD